MVSTATNRRLQASPINSELNCKALKLKWEVLSCWLTPQLDVRVKPIRAVGNTSVHRHPHLLFKLFPSWACSRYPVVELSLLIFLLLRNVKYSTHLTSWNGIHCPQIFTKTTLLNASLANSTFCKISPRVLFENARFNGVASTLKFVVWFFERLGLLLTSKKLLVNLQYVSYCACLCAFVSWYTYVHRTLDFVFLALWKLLADALSMMSRLDPLLFALNSLSDHVLQRCTFPLLREFASISFMSPELYHFLNRDPSIRELFIGADAEIGCMTMLDSSLPFLNGFIGSRSFAKIVVPGKLIFELTLGWFTSVPIAEIIPVFQDYHSKGSRPLEHFACATSSIPERYILHLETIRINHFGGAELRLIRYYLS